MTSVLSSAILLVGSPQLLLELLFVALLLELLDVVVPPPNCPLGSLAVLSLQLPVVTKVVGKSGLAS